MKVATFFKNKYVLYLLTFLGLINVLGYVALEDYNSMALFVVMLLLSRYFSKEWSLNILISILVSSVVSMNNKVREGFKEGGFLMGTKKDARGRGAEKGQKIIPSTTTSEKSNSKRNSKTFTKGRGYKDPGQRIIGNTSKKVNSPEKRPVSIIKGKDPKIGERPKEEEEEKPKEEEEKPEEEKPKEEEEPPKLKEDGDSCKTEVECASGGCNEGICGPPKQKKPERFKNNVPPSSPSAVNGNADEDTNAAAQMEDAYNSFNQLLGDGSFKSMAKETKQLVNQQKELMSTLTSMTPALNNAKETLAGLKLPSMEKMTGILKRFNK